MSIADVATTGHGAFFPEEMTLLGIFRRLLTNDKGATAIEYTLIASLIAVAAIAALQSAGGETGNTLGMAGQQLPR